MGAVGRVGRGIGRAVRARPGVLALVSVVGIALAILGPPVLLSAVRRPVDYFTLNPWLSQLGEYLRNPAIPWSVKAEKLPRLALFWFSADSPFGGTDWGFAVDVTDLVRIVLTAVLFGVYFALWAHLRRPGPVVATSPAGGAGGTAGLLTSVVGLSTGPCSVMGCGAPVIPVVGLAFSGLSSGALALLAGISQVGTVVVLAGLLVGVAWLGWRAGARQPLRATSAGRAG